MSVIKIMGIYHSFLLKKWYLFLYLLAMIVLIIGAIAFVNNQQQREELLQLGIVDQDQTKETQMILTAIGEGKEFTEQFKLKALKENEAEKSLDSKKIDGYIVFEKGMTAAFYKSGELPIRVYTYDETTVQSIVIRQLADSVYARLMLSESGILTYGKLAGKPSDEQLLAMMMDLLFVGLDREAAFKIEEVKTYDLGKYAMISAYFIAIFFIYWMLSTILKMNQSPALQKRLKLYPNVQMKLLVARNILSVIYTVILTAILTAIIVPLFDLATYNIGYLIVTIMTLVLSLLILFTFIDLLQLPIVKIVVILFVVALSGATIPIMYMKHLHVENQLFAQLFNSILQLLHSNYVVEFTWSFYVQLLILILILISAYVWRRFRSFN